MKTRAKITSLLAIAAAAAGIMAFAAGPAYAEPFALSDFQGLQLETATEINPELLDDLGIGAPEAQPGGDLLNEPPFDETLGDPPIEPPTVVKHTSTEGPCIDGFKEVTDYVEYSNGTAASSIALVPCDCTIAVESWMIDCNYCYIDACGQVHCTDMLCPGTDGGDDKPGPDNPGITEENPGNPDQPGNPGQPDNPNQPGNPGQTPTPVTPTVTATSLPNTGAELALIALVGAGTIGAAGLALVSLRKLRQ